MLRVLAVTSELIGNPSDTEDIQGTFIGSAQELVTGSPDGGTGNLPPLIGGLLLFGGLLAVSVVLLRRRPRQHRWSRLLSALWSVALLLALLFTWRTIVADDRWAQSIGTPVTSESALEEFIASHPETFAQYDYLIPTGVYLQSFEFLNASNVHMSGFVWQTFAADIPEHVQRRIVLPEALDEAYKSEEAWRFERDGAEHIGWYFSGDFRQNFDYQLYPFDRQNIWIRLWSPEAVENVALVPDFGAYRDLAPHSLPGIDTQFVYGGWDPVSSEFTYELLDYNVNFGLGYGFSEAPDAELYFNLAVERDYLGPMLEHLVMAGAISILLFVLLLLMDDQSGPQDRVGLTIFDLSVAAGGLLFAVILDHNGIREEVESQSIMYLEWVPLLLVVFIVLVVLSAVLQLKGWRVPYLGYRGDLMPVLLYWPALLGSLLFITLVVFFL
jgi:hypothetical protein